MCCKRMETLSMCRASLHASHVPPCHMACPPGVGCLAMPVCVQSATNRQCYCVPGSPLRDFSRKRFHLTVGGSLTLSSVISMYVPSHSELKNVDDRHLAPPSPRHMPHTTYLSWGHTACEPQSPRSRRQPEIGVHLGKSSRDMPDHRKKASCFWPSFWVPGRPWAMNAALPSD